MLTGCPDGAWIRYDTPAEEFLLRRLGTGHQDPAGVSVPDGGPRILLCTAGAAGVRADGDDVEITRGCSVWLDAADKNVTVHLREEGTELFVAGDALP